MVTVEQGLVLVLIDQGEPMDLELVLMVVMAKVSLAAIGNILEPVLELIEESRP